MLLGKKANYLTKFARFNDMPYVRILMPNVLLVVKFFAFRNGFKDGISLIWDNALSAPFAFIMSIWGEY